VANDLRSATACNTPIPSLSICVRGKSYRGYVMHKHFSKSFLTVGALVLLFGGGGGGTCRMDSAPLSQVDI
jgi:hypothetical protein